MQIRPSNYNPFPFLSSYILSSLLYPVETNYLFTQVMLRDFYIYIRYLENRVTI